MISIHFTIKRISFLVHIHFINLSFFHSYIRSLHSSQNLFVPRNRVLGTHTLYCIYDFRTRKRYNTFYFSTSTCNIAMKKVYTSPHLNAGACALSQTFYFRIDNFVHTNTLCTHTEISCGGWMLKSKGRKSCE